MGTLPGNIRKKVESLIKEGDSLRDQSRYRDALKPYMEVYAVLPNPKEDWDVSIALFNALGNCHFELKEYGAADYFYNQVLFCEDGFGSAEAWLGIGKSNFELGNKDKAKEALLSAYMLEGKDIFTEKFQKYFEILDLSELTDFKK